MFTIYLIFLKFKKDQSIAIAANIKILESKEILEEEKKGDPFSDKLKNFILTHAVGECMNATSSMAITPDLRMLLAEKICAKYPSGINMPIVILIAFLPLNLIV